jgi:hypothetical protein
MPYIILNFKDADGGMEGGMVFPRAPIILHSYNCSTESIISSIEEAVDKFGYNKPEPKNPKSAYEFYLDDCLKYHLNKDRYKKSYQKSYEGAPNSSWEKLPSHNKPLYDRYQNLAKQELDHYNDEILKWKNNQNKRQTYEYLTVTLYLNETFPLEKPDYNGDFYSSYENSIKDVKEFLEFNLNNPSKNQ